ncbi:MAG TPA: hypothetical protein VIL60_02230 [Rhodanobacter sp.]
MLEVRHGVEFAIERACRNFMQPRLPVMRRSALDQDEFVLLGSPKLSTQTGDQFQPGGAAANDYNS